MRQPNLSTLSPPRRQRWWSPADFHDFCLQKRETPRAGDNLTVLSISRAEVVAASQVLRKVLRKKKGRTFCLLVPTPVVTKDPAWQSHGGQSTTNRKAGNITRHIWRVAVSARLHVVGYPWQASNYDSHGTAFVVPGEPK